MDFSQSQIICSHLNQTRHHVRFQDSHSAFIIIERVIPTSNVHPLLAFLSEIVCHRHELFQVRLKVLIMNGTERLRMSPISRHFLCTLRKTRHRVGHPLLPK